MPYGGCGWTAKQRSRWSGRHALQSRTYRFGAHRSVHAHHVFRGHATRRTDWSIVLTLKRSTVRGTSIAAEVMILAFQWHPRRRINERHPWGTEFQREPVAARCSQYEWPRTPADSSRADGTALGRCYRPSLHLQSQETTGLAQVTSRVTAVCHEACKRWTRRRYGPSHRSGGFAPLREGLRTLRAPNANRRQPESDVTLVAGSGRRFGKR